MATAPVSAPAPAPVPARPRRSRGRRILRAFLWVVGLVLLLLVVVGLWLHHRVAASLPQLRGELAIPGLSAPVAVERDALGVPNLRAETRLDAARALGFVHAQDRFFQMDLLRREAAGEFSELFGPFMLLHDHNRRRHGCVRMAEQILAGLPPPKRALLEAYADGVNAGLKALGDKPFEYIVLRAEPRPWRPEDSILAIYAMHFDLEDWRTTVETGLGKVRDRVPQKFFDFVDPAGSTEWDAPLVGDAIPTPPIPGPDVYDLRKAPAQKQAALSPREPAETPPGFPGSASGEDLFATGSNAWAVAGSHTADGHALLANDMHLGITIPNIWYRASWSWRDPDGTARRVTGTTLPGAPLLATGSTGRIAWGFTNSFVDVVDLIDLQLDPHDPESYMTPAGPRRFEHSTERIRVKGQRDEMFDVVRTIWGPVVDKDPQGRPRRALAWSTDSPEATNLGLFDLESAKNVDEAIEIAHATGIPPQNFVVADSSGRIGWTIIGKIPRRVGWSGQVPGSWADGTHRWDGWLRSDEVPKVVDPPSGRIWSANQREVDPETQARLLGDGCYDLGARAKQIRDRLLAIEKATPQDMLALQLDDRALFLSRWRDLLLATLTPAAVKADPRRGELRRLVETTWTGEASVNSVAYRVVREFRDTLEKEVFASLTGYGGSPDDLPFYRSTRRFEGPLWRLVTERPAHLLDPRFASWDAQLLAVADEVRKGLEKAGPLAGRTWGEGNTLIVQHPLGGLPLLGRWLNIQQKPLPGDLDMPRVIGKFFSSSERMVVSPGHEEAGIFHMPTGESGHPMSPHYRDGHAAWEEGRPTPLLPGPPVDVLKLVPKKS